MKDACAHFQGAAWAFHTLPDRHASIEGTLLNVDYLALMSQISLAQAQECILEKSILDHKKPAIIVKVAAQIVEFYKQSNVKIEASKGNVKKAIGGDFLKTIAKYCYFKELFYNSVANFFMGLSCEEESKWWVEFNLQKWVV